MSHQFLSRNIEDGNARTGPGHPSRRLHRPLLHVPACIDAACIWSTTWSKELLVSPEVGEVEVGHNSQV
jgi:hypothetical protein